VDARATRDEDDAYAAASSGPRRSGDQSWFASLGAVGYLMFLAGAALVIVILVAAVGSSGGWAVPAVAVLVLLAGLAAVATFLLKRTGEVDKPSAGEVADLEAHGVRNPEKALNDRLDHEQKDEITPDAAGAEPVGPGRGE
jgi:hypothetical protein